MKIKNLRTNGNILSYTVYYYCKELKETYVQYRLITHTCRNDIFILIERYLITFFKSIRIN